MFFIQAQFNYINIFLEPGFGVPHESSLQDLDLCRRVHLDSNSGLRLEDAVSMDSDPAISSGSCSPDSDFLMTVTFLTTLIFFSLSFLSRVGVGPLSTLFPSLHLPSRISNSFIFFAILSSVCCNSWSTFKVAFFLGFLSAGLDILLSSLHFVGAEGPLLEELGDFLIAGLGVLDLL